MVDFPSPFPGDAVDLLYGMLVGNVPFDQCVAEKAAWNILGYAFGAVYANNTPVDWTAPVCSQQELCKALAPDKKTRAAIPWEVLIPAVVSLFQTFLPTKAKEAKGVSMKTKKTE